jgi:hypothetical protein
LNFVFHLFCSGKCECALFGGYVDQFRQMFAKIVDVMPVVVLQFAKVKVFRGMSFANCIFFYIIQFLLFVVRYSFVAILILDLLFYVDILDKISLHNVMSTTRLLLNPDIDDVVSFRHRYSPLFCPLTTLFVFKLFEVLPFMVLRQVSMFLSLVLVSAANVVVVIFCLILVSFLVLFSIVMICFSCFRLGMVVVILLNY